VNFSALAEPDGNPSDLADRLSAEGRWVRPPSVWPETNPEDLLLRRELIDGLEEAIQALPANQRSVLMLRDIEGLEATEVCNVLEITETNQRVLLHRARTRLRTALEKHLKRA
jgi:RNA polymerase sigma-70 factor (ECF subfamily)